MQRTHWGEKQRLTRHHGPAIGNIDWTFVGVSWRMLIKNGRSHQGSKICARRMFLRHYVHAMTDN